MDHTWRTHMQMLMKRMRNIEVSQKIDAALFEYYSEKGMQVPQWKMKKDPQWWIDYLESLGLDKDNQ